MEGRDAGNTVAALIRQRPISNVSEFELKIRKLRRALASEANHFRRQVEGQHVLGTFSQSPGKPASAAANFQCVMTIRREMTQQEVVIMIVVCRTVFGDQGNSIKVLLKRFPARARRRLLGTFALVIRNEPEPNSPLRSQSFDFSYPKKRLN